MDKKKLKLSVSGNTKKTINNIEQARSNPKNSVIINNNRNFQKKKSAALAPDLALLGFQLDDSLQGFLLGLA